MAGEDGGKRDELPYKLTLSIPFPTAHLAKTAYLTLSVDKEPSSDVRCSYALKTPSDSPSTEETILEVSYSADTNRMLRIAVNRFLESIGVVIGVMKELDIDVVDGEVVGGLAGVQGLEGVKS